MSDVLVPGLCSQCSAVLQLDPNQDAAICPSCGTPFIVKKAISQYNITSQGQLNISNSVIQMGPSAANLARRGHQFLEAGDFDKANEYFEKALDVDVECAEANEGMMLLKLEKQKKQNEAIFANAQQKAADHKYQQAIFAYQELVRREPDNMKYVEAFNETCKRAKEWSYIIEPMDYMGGLLPVSGVFHLTSQYFIFVPTKVGKTSFTIPVTAFVGAGAERSGLSGSGKLDRLKIYFNQGGGQYVREFRTEKAYDLAACIRNYIANGFD